MSYDEHDDQNGPRALREALEKANKRLAELEKANAEKDKKLAESTLAKILADKKVPANIQRWIKRDEVAADEAAVEKWLEENGADFGYKPGATEESEVVKTEEAPAQAAPAAQSVLTPEIIGMLQEFQEAFGGGTSGPRMPADQAKAAVDDVASKITIDHTGVDFNKAVQMLQDKGIEIGGNISYVGQ